MMQCNQTLMMEELIMSDVAATNCGCDCGCGCGNGGSGCNMIFLILILCCCCGGGNGGCFEHNNCGCGCGGKTRLPKTGKPCYDSRLPRLQPGTSGQGLHFPPFPFLPCLRLTHSSSISYTVLSSITNLYHMVCSSPLVRSHRGGTTGVPPYHNICKIPTLALIFRNPA